MALKPRYKRRILWTIIAIIGMLVMAIVLVPPMINLNNLKPKIEQVIVDQTGVAAKINGDIHFSLLGHATIVAHDVEIPNGEIGALMFFIPFTHIFNIENAPLTGEIDVYDGNIVINNLVPKNFNHPVEIHNSKLTFKNHELEIIDAELRNGHLVGVVRTEKHKYDIDFNGDEISIRNQNDKMNITGKIFTDGSVRGKISMETNDINRWFGFSEPKIDKTINLSMLFDWDGDRGWAFKDIKMDKISGDITIMPNGDKIVKLRGHDIVYDLSFLTQPSRIFSQTNFDLDFTGDMKFGARNFKHIKVNAIGTRDEFQIESIIADDIAVNGGMIDENGAHNLMITMPYYGIPATCNFYGTPAEWKCERFLYGDFVGAVSISPDKFDLLVYSELPSPDRDDAIKRLLEFAPRGHIDFEFADIAGTYEIDGDTITPSYRFAHNKTLQWLDPGLTEIPNFMRNAVGDFSWNDNMMHFVPNSGRWELYLTDTYFYISGKNAKDWFPGIDMQAFNSLPYTISGTYNGNTVSNLEIKIAEHTFTGTLSGNNLTLRTDILDLGAFINSGYLNNYEELSFFTTSPITMPFDLNINISLSADALIYDGNIFKNFLYSLKPNIQTFSITDSDRGNMLATLSRDGNRYSITAQLNKFLINGMLLSNTMPLNIRDALITAEIDMNTFGNIAHDLEYNLNGDIDLTIEGGFFIGLGVDDFFASANQINTFNAEYALSYALDGGESAIKTMRIIGKYDNGDFVTTQPVILRLRHTDATGEFEIKSGQMYANMNLVLRGTSPLPSPIDLKINPNNSREYSLSEIMMNFDPTFMRDFISTHKKF